MTLVDLGYSDNFEQSRHQLNLQSFGIGRVVQQHKDRYIVNTDTDEFDCELIGNLRYTVTDRRELPSVGDWVAISEYDDGKALIHAVLPRNSSLERKAVGKSGQAQIIAANVDVGLIVQSVNRDFSINRLERYLTICNASNIQPIVILSKIDLVEESVLKGHVDLVQDRLNGVSIISISNESQIGIDEVKALLIKGKTYCLLGSSGVGKSTLINSITGDDLVKTGAISESIDRGKHVTTHRELIVLDRGILIDNPGMREVGITDSSEGFDLTFEQILDLSHDCRYNDCSHTSETGCAVLTAIENGDLNSESYENFLKMEKEKEHFESSAKQRRKKDKDIGKLIKEMKKNNYKY